MRQAVIKAAAAVFIMALSAPAFAQQESPAYGQAGVWEIGIDASAGYAYSEQYLVLGGMPMDSVNDDLSVDLSVFTKYFIFDGFHVGGKLSYRMALTYGYDILTAGSHSITLTVSPGYTIAITPIFNVDLNVSGGVTLQLVHLPVFYVTIVPTVQPEIMLLFPVFENIVLGFGYHLSVFFWFNQTITEISPVYGQRTGTIDGVTIEHGAKFQISFFF